MNGLTPTASLVYDRIEKIAPEYVMRIMTYLSNQLPSEYMSVLASAPDKLFQEIVSVAKVDLQLLPPKPSSPVFSLSATDPRWDSDPLQFCHGNVPSHYQQPCAKQQPEFAVPPGYLELQNQSQNQLLPSGEQVEKVALGEMEFTVDYLYNKELEQHLNGRAINRRHSNISDYPIKICHYFSRGYCKHGNNCRYLHVQASRDEFSPILAPFLNDRAHDHQMFSPGSLEKLELEIAEILKSRSGNPLSIATLPTVYYEKYGKVLQAEGYLTESQRQGKAGHSLTRLLSRLGSIRLIDRPHGQHAVVLAKDAMKYFEGRYEGSPVNSSLRQIYLTFPAESTFSEEDVSKYFSNYGLVEDVRIPSQHNRMFGFVTFVNPETAQMILAKGNPHYVCGARVLVKPYKEKSKLIDRKYQERTECRSQQHMQPYMDADSKLRSVPRGSETSRLLRRQQLMDRHAQAFEFERNRHLAQLQIVREHYQQQQHYLVNSMNALKISEGHSNVLSVNFGYLVDVLNSSSAEDNKVGLKETANPDHESDVLNLQDSTFAASIVNSVIN